jgi:hypothetical protein
VRHHLKKGGTAAIAPEATEAAPTMLASASETRLDSKPAQSDELIVGSVRYTKTPYAPPQPGSIYLVRDKAKTERIIRVTEVGADGAHIQVEIVTDGAPSKQTIQLAIESLARQAEKGWCNLLVPHMGVPDMEVAETHAPSPPNAPEPSDPTAGSQLRLDSQNFSRCCGDVIRAKIKFSTQLIKDVCDGPFRAGNYDQAFLTFEQLAVQFNLAVGNCRREIAEGRRTLMAQKKELSGKEVQDRTAAFVRHEQLIHTAEREFSTILEGLRMYLRAQHG